MRRFFAVDFERSGLFEGQACAKRDQILAVGAVEVCDGAVVAQHEWLCNPGTTIPLHTQRIHGITADMLAHAPSWSEVGPALLQFLGTDAPVFLHGRHNDMAGWTSDSLRNGIPLIDPNRVVCSQKYASKAFSTRAQIGLDALCDRLSVDRGARVAAHGALLDAQLLAQCLIRMLALPLPTHTDHVVKRPTHKRPKPHVVRIGTANGHIVFVKSDDTFVSVPIPTMPDGYHLGLCSQKRNVLVRRGAGSSPENPLGPCVVFLSKASVVLRTLRPNGPPLDQSIPIKPCPMPACWTPLA